jgi:uncharacterized protein YegJ (DUF2314 family)
VWWKRKLDLQGVAFFRGTLAPSLSGLDGLGRANVAVETVKPASEEIWAAKLRHSHWGNARLSAPRNAAPPTQEVVQFSTGLTEGERETIQRDAQSVLALEVPSQTGDVLRDRKQFLRFLAAVLGSDGVAGLDLMAQTFWPPSRLADELRHDAPLDIIHIHVFHVVTMPAGLWMHSHGLSEIGFIDFDVLRPAEELMGNQFDLLRAIAFQIVEGASSGLIEPAMGAEPVALTDAQSFMRSAAAEDRALRDPEGHSDRRVVCCDSPSAGILGRLFGANSVVRPSRLLSRGMIEGRHLVAFSKASTELTSIRARESLALLEPFRAEFEDLQCTPLVKMGYPTDSGHDGSEHLWFEVHGVSNNSIDATLVNEPFDIAAMKAGQRAQHPVDFVSDWAIVTPLGQLTPRSMEVARRLREMRPKILEHLRSQS